MKKLEEFVHHLPFSLIHNDSLQQEAMHVGENAEKSFETCFDMNIIYDNQSSWGIELTRSFVISILFYGQ